MSLTSQSERNHFGAGFHISPSALCLWRGLWLWRLHQSFRDSSALDWLQKLTLYKVSSSSSGRGRCRHVGMGRLGRRDVYRPHLFAIATSARAPKPSTGSHMKALCTTGTFKLWGAIKTPTFRSGGVGRSSSDACFACCLARSHGHETEIESRAEEIDDISRAQRRASDGAPMRIALCYIRTVYV